MQLLARDSAAPLREKRISGPLMDRFDIHIEVPRADYEKLTSGRLGEPIEQVRARTEAARAVQQGLLADAVLSGNRQIALNVCCWMPRSPL